MKIFRVEIECGDGQFHGPYSSSFIGSQALYTADSDEVRRVRSEFDSMANHKLPAPCNDCDINIKFNEICGCCSAVSLLEWYNDIPFLIRNFLDIGFRIAEYEVSDFRAGRYQVVFNRDSAQFIRSIDFDEFMQMYNNEQFCKFNSKTNS